MAVKTNELSLPEVVRQTRKIAGLTQAQLAEMAGVGKTLIFNLEKGHEKIGLDNLKKILRILNIKMSFLPPSSLAQNLEKKR